MLTAVAFAGLYFNIPYLLLYKPDEAVDFLRNGLSQQQASRKPSDLVDINFNFTRES